MRRRLLLAWHRHQLAHWAWWVLVNVDANRPAQVGRGLRLYDREDRIIADLTLFDLP